MKTGLTLEQLAAEITRQQNAKEDYVVNTGNLRLESYGHDLAPVSYTHLDVYKRQGFAHQQHPSQAPSRLPRTSLIQKYRSFYERCV